NGDDAELFIQNILPSARNSWVQIAHAGGGLPLKDDNHAAVLRTFAEHIAHEDARTRHVLFDVSFVPALEETPEAIAAGVKEMRRIGMKGFLFGSDFNVLTPLEETKNLEKLGLSDSELRRLRENCAPWACG